MATPVPKVEMKAKHEPTKRRLMLPLASSRTDGSFLTDEKIDRRKWGLAIKITPPKATKPPMASIRVKLSPRKT